MNKALFGMTLLLIVGLFLAGCSNAPEAPVGEQNIVGDITSQDTPEVYVDEQIIDETQDVEIGEMI